MKELLCHQKDALLILPFVSIVQEKVQTISEFATELGFLVEEYAGGKGRFPPIKRQTKKSLYIATMEKGHSLINSLIDTERMSSLGLVIVDELHMIGEGGSRGATLESTLLKLLKFKDVQIVGMSATLNNLQDLQAFMKAEVYHNDFRPVSLQEYVKVEDNIFHVNNKALSADEKLQHDKTVTFPYSSEVLKQDPDHLLGLVLEVIPQHSCLLFCPTKKNCENVAMMLSKLMCNYHRHLTDVNKVKRKELLAELKQNGNGMLCPVLEYTVHFGIAYHHSGLTGDERKVIEEAYANGVLCLLTCTSTLAAGVNLPAKRVILRSPHIGSCFIKYSQYKQMVGRAGRAGIDSSGESILIVKRQDRMKAKDLFAGPQDFCYSSLGHDDGTGVRSLLLSSIGLKLITDTKSAFDLVKSSLLNIQAEELGVDVEALTRDALKCLRDENLILESGNDSDESESSSHLQVTSLGKATFKGAVNHTYSSQLYNDLKQAEESLNLSTHLHLLYLVTPYDAARDVSPDWNIYLNQFCKLSEMELKAAAAVGVPESYINLKASGRRPRKKVSELTVKRFYLTLILWDLWNQRSVWDVADRFSLPRGYVQNLLAQAAAFASCVFHFCQELEEFWAYQDLMQNFVKRLGYCVTTELVPLMEVPGVKLARAKQLFAAGYKTVSQLSFAEPTDLTKHIEHLSLRAARQLICAAKNVLEEKTAVLLEEVENLVAVPGGTLNTGSTEKPI
ncbi:helicase POLQ-like isoform X2 [Aplysia californica]|nr:helicase POLQ-like isoform X2 [Aplysia californica]